MSDSPIPDLSTVASPPRQPVDYTELRDAREPIGSGGQAAVYEATLSGGSPPDRVALKEPSNPDTLDYETVETFLQEAATWRTVDRRERQKPRWADSEHIVGVVDTGEELPWIAMEYMDGGGLDDRLDQQSEGLPLAEALWVGECICRGVELAHNYGIAHLDLKPANVLFRETPDDQCDVPKIADWGLARVLAEQTGTMEGLSVKYAAPEQFEPNEFGDPDMLTDIYQVGALVYALLTGEPPHTGSQLSVMSDVVNGDGPDPPSTRRSDVPEALDSAVQIALKRSKTDRYRNIATFAQALQAIRTGQALPPVVSRHAGTASGGHSQSQVGSGQSGGRSPSEAPRTTAPWPMFQGGPARTGHHPRVTGPSQSVTTRWTLDTGGGVLSSPAVANDTVYVGSGDNSVYAIDASDGTTRWTLDTGGRVYSPPAVANGTVYVGSGDRWVYAIDASDGTTQWTLNTGNPVVSSPAVANGTVYVGSYDNSVYAIE